MRIRDAVPEDAPVACEVMRGGCVTNSGEITLNYVSPDTRFRGVSKALLRALEARAIEQGNERCTLSSTETARRFYLARGFTQDGPADGKFGMNSGHPMSKRLIAEGSGRAGK
jgi:GNAT superfamily N-acetyltransferase